MKNLPENIHLDMSGIKLLFVDGSHRKIDEYLYEDEAILKTISDEGKSNAVIFGHTHIAFHRVIYHIHFINVGSVGNPKMVML